MATDKPEPGLLPQQIAYSRYPCIYWAHERRADSRPQDYMARDRPQRLVRRPYEQSRPNAVSRNKTRRIMEGWSHLSGLIYRHYFVAGGTSLCGYWPCPDPFEPTQ